LKRIARSYFVRRFFNRKTS